jgi:hypothetical protein
MVVRNQAMSALWRFQLQGGVLVPLLLQSKVVL